MSSQARMPPRQPCQSIGDLPMRQGLASDLWLLYLSSPRSACMERKENLQLQTGLSGIFSEIALNDKGGESLDKGIQSLSTKDSASWNKAFSLRASLTTCC